MLVSYNELNKVVRIPLQSGERDLEYLRRECRKLFKFGTNISLDFVFQKFDPEWGELIDLSEDSVLKEKDKLKMMFSQYFWMAVSNLM